MNPEITHVNSYHLSSKLHARLLEHLDQRGFRQKSFVPVQRESDLSYNDPAMLQHGQMVYVKCFSVLDKPFWPVKVLKLWRAFRSVLGDKPSGILHAHSLLVNGAVAWLAHRTFSIPYAVSVRFTDIHVFMEWMIWFRWIGWRILRDADEVVFLSPSYKDKQLLRLLGPEKTAFIQKKSTIIPNGIDSFWIKNRQKKERNPQTGKISIIFAGQLIKRKNPGVLIQVCALLQSQGLDVRLDMAGSGPLLSSLKKEAVKAGVNAHFHGEVSTEELITLYRNSDILAVTSVWETFGLVYPEAMTQGLPIIYSENQGFDGYFPDGKVGYAVRPKDPADIADKILKISSRYETLSKNAYEESAAFSWDKVTDSFSEIYTRMLNRRNTAG
ncbi:MAG: glycosyltransferase family 4 protein [Balneolales bacterium]|nr:glycosyltransferase family 4 protein [Balneolales bacterium]